ncbi:MAG: MBL fold metallo-hydrolase [Acidobacteria bacterium]|nr:MBL fold metallo-hydrolase [Acidobacteriota bacterium]
MLLPLLFLAVSVSAETKVVLLGAGNPNADPERSGPSVAVVVDAVPYIVDFGPGVVRRAAAAARKGVPGLAVENLRTAFATHLHSDHTSGLSDLFLTPAVLDRHAPLLLYGPPGIRAMAGHVRQAYREDVEIRTKGLEFGDPKAYRIEVREIQPGVIHRDERVTVRASAVKHGQWKHAYGYRFDSKDGRSVVISGDCGPSDAIVEACNGCDVLLHEVYSVAGFRKRTPQWQRYHSSFHTSSEELGRIAARARPKVLVLYHQLVWSSNEAELMKELRAVYTGRVVYGNDLDVF